MLMYQLRKNASFRTLRIGRYIQKPLSVLEDSRLLRPARASADLHTIFSLNQIISHATQVAPSSGLPFKCAKQDTHPETGMLQQCVKLK